MPWHSSPAAQEAASAGKLADATHPKVATSPNPLKIGANMPDFALKTTKGDFSFHSFLTGDADKPWTIFFSHPNDFTPVCTTELGACHSLTAEFGQLGAKLIGVSCNTTESHEEWSKDVLANLGDSAEALNFPIIADLDRQIVNRLGMLDPEEVTAEGIPLPARALVILHGTTVKLTILYPATTGRNFDEIKRILISLQLTASNGLATPVDWKYGDRLIVGPPVQTEDAKAKFQDFNIEQLPSGKEYLRSVKCLELSPEMSKTQAPVNTAEPPPGPNPLKIGATLPNFSVHTTKGDFELHTWLTGDSEKPWTIFFTHPKDYTPVCTTELGACHKLAARAATLGCKLIGLSCDETESHHAWSKDVLARIDCAGDESLSFPMIADSDRDIVTRMGMLDPEEKDAVGVPLPARALLILNGTTVKLSILYPATTGRDFDEVLRTLVSLQLTANNGLATPVDWKYGERVIVGPAVKTEDAQAKFQDFQLKELPSGKPYLRSVACPAAGLKAPALARPGQKVLIVCTSANEMAGHPTGIWLEEVAAPYYLFKAAGIEVVMASVKGGMVPIDSGSMAEGFFTDPAKKFMHDPEAIGAFAHTTAIADIVAAGPVDATYAAIFLPGGHGTCGEGDIHDNVGVKTAVEQMFHAGKIVAAVCHGPTGLIQCVKASGEPLVKGLKVAAFNNSEEKAVQLDAKVPFSLEDKMKEQGAEYVSGGDWSANAVKDQNLITGQNPQSSEKVAELIVAALS